MKNLLRIKRCEFKDTYDGIMTKGYRMFDDHHKSYNSMVDIPDNNLKLLELISNDMKDYIARDIEQIMIGKVIDNSDGIEIDGIYYNYEEIQDYL